MKTFTKIKFKLTSFLLLISLSTFSQITTINNTSTITINDNAAATPYPSNIVVSNVPGIISNISVTIHNLSHTWVHDMSIILQAPTGQSLLLQSGCADGASISNVTYTIADAGATQFSSTSNWSNGIYKPTGYFWDIWPSPGPLTPPGVNTYNTPGPFGPYTATFASTFNGLNPNGTWKLYVADFASGDAGIISGGWSLNINQQFNFPIVLKNFTAKCHNGEANLNWDYSTEINLDYFEIMKSIDGKVFSSIGKVNPMGENINHSFNYELKNNEKNKTYYKLRMVDKDGNDSYSEIITLLCENSNSILVYPTIVNDVINIKSEMNDLVGFELIDNLGNNIFKLNANNEFSKQINLNDLKILSGNYQLKVIRKDIIEYFRIIKL